MVRVWARSSQPTHLKSGSPPEKSHRLYPLHPMFNRSSHSRICNQHLIPDSHRRTTVNPVIHSPAQQTEDKVQQVAEVPEHPQASINPKQGRTILPLTMMRRHSPVLTCSRPDPDSIRRRKPSTARCSGAGRKNAVAPNYNLSNSKHKIYYVTTGR